MSDRHGPASHHHADAVADAVADAYADAHLTMAAIAAASASCGKPPSRQTAIGPPSHRHADAAPDAYLTMEAIAAASTCAASARVAAASGRKLPLG